MTDCPWPAPDPETAQFWDRSDAQWEIQLQDAENKWMKAHEHIPDSYRESL